MAKICGIEIKSSDVIVAVLDNTNSELIYIDAEPRKIKLGNDEDNVQIRSFYDSFTNFLRDNHIEAVVIKKRAKNGQMAGGAISFKIEALIQLNEIASVHFVSGQGIAAAQKKEPFALPAELNRYQENAFMAAALYVRKL